MKRTHSLKHVFVKYFIYVVLSFVMILIIYINFARVVVEVGLIQESNAIEKELDTLTADIEKDEDFDFSRLPAGVLYALIENDNIYKSNMPEKVQDYALDLYFNQNKSREIPLFYIVIERKKDTCILFYEIKPRYTIAWMEKYLPDFDIILLFLLTSTCIAAFVCITFLFAKRLNKRLRAIIELTEKISEQNLDFTVQKTNIKEFNDVIDAIDKMKEAFKETLIKNWNIRQAKHEQVAALMHDIKTPLTVIKGNTELLSLTKLTDKQKDFVNYSLNNIDRVEVLLKNLSELSRGDDIGEGEFETVDIGKFTAQISEEIQAFCTAKRRTVSITNKIDGKAYINVNIDLLNRAIMNIVSNAISYSSKDSGIEVDFGLREGLFLIKCIDFGKGFSNEDLKKAKQQFYRGDKSRASGEHSGLGLSIADDIVKSFGGRLTLENNVCEGATVSIALPIELQVSSREVTKTKV